MVKFYFLTILSFISISSLNAANRYAVATGAWNATSTWSATMGGAPGAAVPTASDDVIITGGFTVTVSNAAAAVCSSVSVTGTSPTSLGKLVVNATRTLTVSNTATFGNNSVDSIAGTLTLNGDLILIGTAILKQTAGTIAINKGITVDSRVNASLTAGTMAYSGTGSQTIIPLDYFNLEVSGSRTLTNSVTYSDADTIRVKGTFTNTASFATGDNILTGTNILFNGTTAVTLPVLTNYNNVYIVKGTGTVTSGGNFNLTGNLDIRSGTLSMTGLTPNTIYVINASGAANTLSIRSGAILSIGGTTLACGEFPTTFEIENIETNSTVSYGCNSNAVAQIVSNKPYGNFIVTALTNSTNSKTLPTNLSLYGNLSINSSVSGNSKISFLGSNTQTITTGTTGYGSTVAPFNDITIDKTAGTVKPLQNLFVAGVTTLTSGALDLDTFTYTVNSAAPTSVVRTSGYVLSEKTNNKGKLAWAIGANKTAHTFPFGTSAANYIPFTVTNNSALPSSTLGTLSVSTYPTGSDNLPFPAGVTNINRNGTNNSANVVNRFWQIDATGSSSYSATLTFNFTAAEASGISSFNAQRWNATAVPNAKWEDTLAMQSRTATSVTVPGVTTFSPWAVSGNNAPLPVKLTNFKGIVQNNANLLNWATASETAVKNFEVQKAINGASFSTIGTVSANNKASNYTYNDEKSDMTTYYRLKMVDNDGSFEYSNVIAIGNTTLSAIEVFPNPSNGIIYFNNVDATASIQILNAVGSVQNTITSFQNRQIDASNLPNGIYYIRIQAQGQTQVKKIQIAN